MMTRSVFFQLMTNLATARTGWNAGEVERQTDTWWPEFEHFEAAICQSEFTREATSPYVNIANVLIRCKERRYEARIAADYHRDRRDRQAAQMEAPTAGDPHNETGKIGARAARLILNDRSLTLDEAKAKARAELAIQEAAEAVAAWEMTTTTTAMPATTTAAG